MKLSKILLAAMLFIVFNQVQAQTDPRTKAVTLPDWGVAGQDNATYYYIPAAETYYDVRNQEYVYMQDGKWTKSSELPAAYSNYDLFSGYKVVITDKSAPFSQFPSMRAKYPKNYKGETQSTIRSRQ